MSETVRFGRFISWVKMSPLVRLVGPKRWTKMMSGPIARTESRSDSSKPRIIAVIPTIDVMPMTTPSTVSAERILLRAHGVERHHDDFGQQAGSHACVSTKGH